MPNFYNTLKKNAQSREDDEFQAVTELETSPAPAQEADNLPSFGADVITKAPEPVNTAPEPADNSEQGTSFTVEQDPAPAAEKTTAKRVGRPKKGEEKRKGGRPKTKGPTQLTSIALPVQLHTELIIMGGLSKTPFSTIVCNNCSNAMHHTYECESPACNQRFILEEGLEGKCKKPVTCPCCGGNKIRKVNHLKGVSF